MRSTFYHDVLPAIQDTPLNSREDLSMAGLPHDDQKGDYSNKEITIELHIDRVDKLRTGKRLLLFKTICGESSTRTTNNMRLQEENDSCVEFNQLLPLTIGLQSLGDGIYIPLVHYIILDLLVYSKDKSKTEEFLGRVMIPILYLTTEKQMFSLPAGQKLNHSTDFTPLVSFSARLTVPPEDFRELSGSGELPEQLKGDSYQYRIVLSNQTVNFPGCFEKVEIYIPNVDALFCDVKFKADVYLTNFRLLILSREQEHADCSNWLMFPSIASIEKSPYQSLNHRDQKRVYTIKCYDSRLIKFYVPTISRTYRNIKRIGNKLGKKSSQENLVDDKLLYEMKYNGSGNSTPASSPKTNYRHASISSYLGQSTDICDSDGEAKDDLSDNDMLGDELYSENELEIDPAVLYNTSPSSPNKRTMTSPQVVITADFSEDDVSEGSDDDLMSPAERLGSIDVASIDSLDCKLDDIHTRTKSANSISSFTSYIRTGSKSKERKPAPIARKWQHFSKIMMDNLRLRYLFLKVNPIYQPCHQICNGLTETEQESFTKFKRYNIDTEFSRQGNLKDWAKLDNSNYNLCKSYPPYFLIPTRATKKEILQNILEFRSKCRIPALCWLNNSGAILLRSAQPRTGIFYKHCKEDEVYLSAVLKISAIKRSRETADLPFIIFDARSKIAASGNKMKGKGTENIQNYKNAKLCYLDMANIHAIRDSYDRLVGLAQSQCSVHWLKKLDQTQWLVHVQGLVRGAYFVSNHLSANGAALIHCSDGWDRTSQLTSLSLLLIDPFYRTFEGFQVLIEREWLNFGHRFHDRLGLAHPNQRSPIFTLFLDAVHQIMCQHPNLFQFTSNYIIVLSELHGSAWTITFLHNCELERSQNPGGVEIWAVLNAMKPTLTNPAYVMTSRPIVPKTSLRHMRFWREHFLKYDVWVEPLSEDVIYPVVWVPDEAVHRCHGCGEGFSALKRKHHCRLCGNIFCWACACNKICLPEIGYNHPVLVCRVCYAEHSSN